MELPSPVASLIPSLVLKAMATLGVLLDSQRSRLGEYPFFARLGPPFTLTKETGHGAKAKTKQQN